MIRVLALVPYPTGRVPGQRYRIEQWAPLLRPHGIEVTFSAFLPILGMDVLYERGHTLRKTWSTLLGYVKRLREINDVERFDVSFVYREAALMGPTWIESHVARRRPLVFDFDDAIYLPASSAANPISRVFRRGGKAKAICRLAKHVIVGNETLAAFARQYGGAVTEIPSTIDTDVYAVCERPPNRRPVVGWTGSSTTVPYLKTLLPAFSELRRLVDYELRIIGGCVAVPGVDVRCVPWRPESEVQDLRPLDVGLMPLPDDEWSRGKCGMKALQYMGLGIPPVVSPVGVNARIVRDGVSGFHARTPAEWLDRMVLLLRDPGLRARMGAEARRTVEEGYAARVHAPRLAEIFRAVAGA